MKAQLSASLGRCRRQFTATAKASGWDAAAALAPAGSEGLSKTARRELVAGAVSPAWRIHVLVMSNGGFGGIHDKLLQATAGP